MIIHFIAGLPRSGSTLLAALLRQNPHFEATITSPVYRLLTLMREACAPNREGAVFIDDDRRRSLFLGVFESYYGSAERIIFDTNRTWTAMMPLLVELFPEAKVICCVRDVSWVMDSIERLLINEPLGLSGIFNFSAAMTVYDRVAALARSDGMVGGALDCLREAFYGPYRDRLLLIDYETIATHPLRALDRIYEFIGETGYLHNVKGVSFDDPNVAAFDAAFGMPNLHRVRSCVEIVRRETVLPPDLFARFVNDAFWRNAL